MRKKKLPQVIEAISENATDAELVSYCTLSENTFLGLILRYRFNILKDTPPELNQYIVEILLPSLLQLDGDLVKQDTIELVKKLHNDSIAKNLYEFCAIIIEILSNFSQNRSLSKEDREKVTLFLNIRGHISLLNFYLGNQLRVETHRSDEEDKMICNLFYEEKMRDIWNTLHKLITGMLPNNEDLSSAIITDFANVMFGAIHYRRIQMETKFKSHIFSDQIQPSVNTSSKLLDLLMSLKEKEDMETYVPSLQSFINTNSLRSQINKNDPDLLKRLFRDLKAFNSTLDKLRQNKDLIEAPLAGSDKYDKYLNDGRSKTELLKNHSRYLAIRVYVFFIDLRNQYPEIKQSPTDTELFDFITSLIQALRPWDESTDTKTISTWIQNFRISGKSLRKISESK